MYLKNSRLQRRSFLRGVGATIALPLLDAMVPALSSAAAAVESPTRLVFTYMPIGTTMADWLPKTTGRDYEMSRILKPLESLRGNSRSCPDWTMPMPMRWEMVRATMPAPVRAF